MNELSEERFQLEAGTWLAGYDIGQLLKDYKELQNYILQILENETEQQTEVYIVLPVNCAVGEKQTTAKYGNPVSFRQWRLCSW